MRDIFKPVRTSFFSALDGQLTYNSNPVPVSDEKTKGMGDYYVILSTQTSSANNTKCDDDRLTTIILDIVTKTYDSVSKDICDDIADQILQLVPDITPPEGWQYLNLKLFGDRHLTLELTNSVHLVRRLLTYQIHVIQN